MNSRFIKQPRVGGNYLHDNNIHNIIGNVLNYLLSIYYSNSGSCKERYNRKCHNMSSVIIVN